MNAHKLLNEGYRSFLKLEGTLETLRRRRDISMTAKGCNYFLTPGRRGHSSPVEAAVEKIIMTENRLYVLAGKHISICKKIREIISRIEGAEKRMFLQMRYLDMMSWNEIMSKLNIDCYELSRLKRLTLLAVDDTEVNDYLCK